MNASLFSQFEFLRAHVESVAAPPSSLMITSAKVGDGKSLTAHGLAERLADAGRRVALVRCGPLDAALAPQRGDEHRGFPIVRFPPEEENSSIATPTLRSKIDELRASYDYTIIDSAPLLTSRVATLLAGIVDAIIVTVRLGRASDAADTALVQSLGRSDANVLGVVAASAADIAAFAQQAELQHPEDVSVTSYLAASDFSARDRVIVPAFDGWRR